MAELRNGLGGPAGFGEGVLDRNDDGSTAGIDLSSIFQGGLNFFGERFSTIYVNNNGNLTFQGPRSSFQSDGIANSPIPIIAAFFTDIDTRGGAVAPTPGGTSTGSNLVYYDVDQTTGTFTVTWDDVGYFSNGTDRVNAFQIVIQRVGDPADGDFDMQFIYEGVNWATNNGSAEAVAKIGYSNGAGTSFELPISGNETQILQLDETRGTLSFSIRDGQVNNAPFLTDDTATTGEEVPVTIDVLANDADGDGDVITVVGARVSQGGGSVVVNADGTITYTPGPEFDALSPGQTGTATITYDVTDGQTLSRATVTVTVNGANDAPRPVADVANATEETGVTFAVAANDVDPDGDALTVTSALVSGGSGTVTVGANGQLTFTPGAGFQSLGEGETGAATITYTVSDGQLSATGIATVTVTGVNDAPTAVNDRLNVSEDGGLLAVTANDRDIDGDALTVTAARVVSGGGTVTVNPNGTLSFAGSAAHQALQVGETATVSVEYTMTDGRVSSTATALVTVQGANDAPTPASDVTAVGEDGTVTFAVVGNDRDVDGDALSVTGAFVPSGQGSVSVAPDGRLVFTPGESLQSLKAGQVQNVIVNYTVSDGTTSSTGTATVRVTGANDAPVAAADSFEASEDDPLTIDLRLNDSDPDGDSLAVQIGTGPAHGDILINPDGTVTYTPNADYFGPDSFTYRVTDGSLNSSFQTVTLNVVRDYVEPTIEVNAPDGLGPGATGTAQIVYDHNSATGPALVFVTSTGGLIKDPATGKFSQSAFVFLPAAAENAIETISIEYRQASDGSIASGVSAVVADPEMTIDWASLKDGLRPAGLEDAAWNRAFSAFLSEVGTTAGDLTAALAENIAQMASLGLSGTDAGAALAFEIRQALDFGSLAARAEVGEFGRGWASVADLALDLSGGATIVLEGLNEFSSLFTFEANDAARYTLSSSVGRSVDLAGQVDEAAPDGEAVFVRQPTGEYAGSGGASLERTATGYELTTADGVVVTFDAAGRILSATSPTGDLTTVVRDAQGRISSFEGEDGRSLDFDRNAGGQIVRIVGDDDAVSVTRGSDGSLTGANAGSGVVGFGYSASGDLTTVDRPGTEPTDTFSYDAQGRLVSIDRGGQSLSITYDDDGGFSVTDETGVTTDVDVASDGSVARITNPDGDTTELVFDSQGRVIGSVDANGVDRSYSYDAQGRLASATDGEGGVLRFTYDGDSGRPASFTDAKGQTKSFDYDSDGKLTSATWPDGSTFEVAYDSAGRVTAFEDRDGDVDTFSYDAAGRVVRTTGGDNGPTTISYDASGRVVSVTNNGGETDFAYDSAGRVTGVDFANGRSLDYAYDAAGRQTSIVDQDGAAQRFTYDAAGRLSTLSNEDGRLVTYSYDAAGRLTGEDKANGVSTDYAYDVNGRLTSISNSANGTEYSTIDYAYDAVGNRTSMATQDGTWTYGYDDEGQLTRANFDATAAGLADKSLSFTYDLAGNRTSMIEDGVRTNYTYNINNQVTRAGAESFSYDADGNMVSRTGPAGTTRYEYGDGDRLSKTTGPDGKVTTYEYDAFGHRSAVTVDGVRTEMLVDPFGLGDVVAEYGANGALIANYAYGVGLAGRTGADGASSFYDTDALGSVTGLTGANGALLNSYGYTPFGDELYERETVANRFEFNGRYGVSEDADGTQYMRDRQYDVDLGRFTQEEPRWLSGDIANLYRFGFNNPMTYVDPTGQFGDKAASAYGFGKALVDARAGAENLEQARGDMIDKLFEPGVDADDVVGDYQAAQQGFVKGAAGAALAGADVAYGGIGQGLHPGGKALEGAGKALENFDKGKGAWDRLFPPKNDPGAKADDDGAGNPGAGGASQSWGDPHLVSFDGLAYDFQAVGEFTLVRDASRNFEIQVRQQPFQGSTRVSMNAAVAMKVGEDVVEFRVGDGLLINGLAFDLASGASIAVGDGAITRSGSIYVFVNDEGDGFYLNDHGFYLDVNAFASVDERGGLSGLLGNFDGNSANDIRLPDGTVLQAPVLASDLYGRFADAWRVTESNSLFTYKPGESTAGFTDRNFPEEVVRLEDLPDDVRERAEQIVRDAGVEPGTIEFDNAVLDVAISGDDRFADGAADAQETAPDPDPVELVINEAPEAGAPVAVTTLEDVAAAARAVGATDPDGDTLSYALKAGGEPAKGVVTFNQAAGTFVYRPNANANGADQFVVVISDGRGGTVEKTITVDVTPVNDAPRLTGAQAVLPAATEDGSYVLTVAQLVAGYTDVDGDALSVTFLRAAHGAITARPDGTYLYTPNVDFFGTETFTYRVTDGALNAAASLNLTVSPIVAGVRINGTTGADLIDATHTPTGQPLPTSLSDKLSGGAGADTLDGGAGADILRGGAGGDTYVVDNVGDVVDETFRRPTDDRAIDTVRSSVAHTLTANVERLILTGALAIAGTGNALANEIVGNDAANLLKGGDGADTLQGGGGTDTLEGGLGDDVFRLETTLDRVVERAGEGFDTVIAGETYVLSRGQSVERLEAAAGVAPIRLVGNEIANTIVGNAGANLLQGGDGADTIEGGLGDDILDGGLGADRLVGGAGDDRYTIDAAGDVVVEAVGGGFDQVTSTVSYRLGAGQEVERLSLAASTGDAPLTLAGNDFANELIGNAGANRIDGGAGDDTLRGGAGIDTLVGGADDDDYYVDDAGDRVVEVGGGGDDEVFASMSYTLTERYEIERLTLVSTARGDFALTGNEIGNRITAGAGADTLDGRAGADLLIGGAGADTLIGGLGLDTLEGGIGDDVYEVADAGDVVRELAGGGVADLVRSSVDHTLSANVENLTLTGSAAKGTGNDGNNAIVGNNARNTLDGRAGADTMTGGGGDDIYVVDDAGDRVVEAAGGGRDVVQSSVNYVLGGDVEELVLTGEQGIKGSGNALDNVLTGNAKANKLDGRGGADTMAGGDGGDTYVVDDAGDVIRETAAGVGVDKVTAKVDFALTDGAAVEQLLAASGKKAIDLDGNALGQTLKGNNGVNRLDGGGGDDILTGGKGKDVFVFEGDFDFDTISDFAKGADKIELDFGDVDTLKEVKSFGSNVDGGVLFNFDADHQILVKGMTLKAFSAEDFSFI